MRTGEMTLLRCASAILIVVALAAAALAAEPDDPCAGWSMNGYRIGMTRAEAATVRPIGKAPRWARKLPPGASAAYVTTKEFGGFIVFDTEGRLEQWFMSRNDVPAKDVRAALEGRYGTASEKNDLGGVTIRGFDGPVESSWSSQACDAVVTMSVTRPGTVIDVVHIGLNRLSTLRRSGERALE